MQFHSEETADRVRLLKVDEVAAMIGVSVKTVRRMAENGVLPKPVKVGAGARLVRWPVADVTAYLDSLRGKGAWDEQSR